jgi:hypothetical protein
LTVDPILLIGSANDCDVLRIVLQKPGFAD